MHNDHVFDPASEDLFDFVSETQVWQYGDELVFFGDSGGDYPVAVKAVDLASLHPDLPVAIRALLAQNKLMEPEAHGASGANVYYSLMLLMHGTTDIPDENGEPVHFISISSLNQAKDAPGCTHVFGTSLAISYCENEGRKVPFVSDWVGHGLTVPNNMLDQLFPDWQKRQQVALELGLNIVEQISYTLNKKTSASLTSSTMSEVTFD